MQRVVITGMGVYSTIGRNLDEVRKGLYDGTSGIGIDPLRKEMGFRSALTGIIDKPKLKGALPRRLRVGLAEQGEYAYLSTQEALRCARIDEEFLQQKEVGIVFGNDSSALALIESTDIVRERKDTMLLGSAPIFQLMNSTVTMNLSCIFTLRGINFTLSAACASGSHAIGMACVMIRNGMQDIIICGGAQEINPYAMASFDALSAFSVRESAPTEASRPFDRDRDGLVPSGGAASLVLESRASAIARGAPVLGEIVGYGFSSNGEHISMPNVDGPIRAMEMALTDAGCRADEIDYINAHATSTPAGDSVEAKALHTIFGSSGASISSTKSLTGHECWMAGASEVVYSLLMMQDSFIAPNINLDNPDEDAAKLRIVSSTTEKPINAFLSNSFGFGGTNSALIVRKYTGT